MADLLGHIQFFIYFALLIAIKDKEDERKGKSLYFVLCIFQIQSSFKLGLMLHFESSRCYQRDVLLQQSQVQICTENQFLVTIAVNRSSKQRGDLYEKLINMSIHESFEQRCLYCGWPTLKKILTKYTVTMNSHKNYVLYNILQD